MSSKTASDTVTGLHKHRFDADGKGLGKAGRDTTAVKGNETPSISRIPPPKSAMTRSSDIPLSKGASDFVARMTNPRLYTGIHKHRFDEDGKGRGRVGRDTGAAMGAGTAKVTVEGENIRDLSQIVSNNIR